MMGRWLILLALFAATPAMAALSERDLAQAVARPAPGTMVPDLPLTDLSGRTASLRAFAQKRPLVLIFADYTCRNICSPGLTITAARLGETGLRPGRDYRLVVVGIDPRDSADDTRHFARAVATMPDVEGVTSFLHGDGATVRAVARALGYGYVYDPQNDQFAHDASIYVFDADGRLTALLPEIGLLAPPLKAALTQTRDVHNGGWVAQAVHVCYGFAAAHGRFGKPIVLALQGLSALLLLIAGGLFWQRRRAA